MTTTPTSGSALHRFVASAVGPSSAGRYALIGISGVALDTVLFVVLVGAGIPPVVATTISTLAGIANNYVLNAKLNFQTGYSGTSAFRFLVVGLLGLVVAAVSLQLLLAFTSLGPLAAKLISLPFVLVAQFLANKYWSFRD